MKHMKPTKTDPAPLETRVLRITDALQGRSPQEIRKALQELAETPAYSMNQAYRDQTLLQQANRAGTIGDQDLKTLTFISSRMLHEGATTAQRLVFQETCHLLREETEPAGRITQAIGTILQGKEAKAE